MPMLATKENYHRDVAGEVMRDASKGVSMLVSAMSNNDLQGIQDAFNYANQFNAKQQTFYKPLSDNLTQIEKDNKGDVTAIQRYIPGFGTGYKNYGQVDEVASGFRWNPAANEGQQFGGYYGTPTGKPEDVFRGAYDKTINDSALDPNSFLSLPFGKGQIKHRLTPDQETDIFMSTVWDNPQERQTWAFKRYLAKEIDKDEYFKIVSDRIDTPALQDKVNALSGAFIEKNRKEKWQMISPPSNKGNGNGGIIEAITPNQTTVNENKFIVDYGGDAYIPQQKIIKIGQVTPIAERGGNTVSAISIAGGNIYSHTSSGNILNGEKFGSPKAAFQFTPSEIYNTYYWNGSDVDYSNSSEGNRGDLSLKKGEPITEEQYNLIKTQKPDLLKDVKQGMFVYGEANYAKNGSPKVDNVSVPYTEAIGKKMAITHKRQIQLPAGEKVEEVKGAGGGKIGKKAGESMKDFIKRTGLTFNEWNKS